MRRSLALATLLYTRSISYAYAAEPRYVAPLSPCIFLLVGGPFVFGSTYYFWRRIVEALYLGDVTVRLVGIPKGLYVVCAASGSWITFTGETPSSCHIGCARSIPSPVSHRHGFARAFDAAFDCCIFGL